MIQIIITYVHTLVHMLAGVIKTLARVPDGTARTPVIISVLLFVAALFNGDSRM